MIVRLPVPAGFSLDAVVRSHGWYDLPPFEYDRAGGTLRSFLARGSRTAALLFRVENGTLTAESTSLGSALLARIARRVFSLDADLGGLEARVAHDPALVRALARGGGRMLRGLTLFEDAVKMLLTTNCSWAATRGMTVRLVAEAGAQGRAFPSPEALASLSVSSLRSRIRCGYRAGALARFARRVASGKLDLEKWEDPKRPSEEVRESILAEDGFGPYAAEGLLRILGRHDYLALDSWVRQKYRTLHPGAARATDRSIARRYARYGAHRGLVLWLELTADWHAEELEAPALNEQRDA